MILVLAGNHRQFKNAFGSNPNYKYISGVDSLRGYHNIKIERIGTWWERDSVIIEAVESVEALRK